MTRDELRRRYDAYGRQGKVVGIASIAFLLFVCAFTIVITARAPRGSVTVPALAVVILLASGILFIVVMSRVNKRRSAAHGLICPNCGKMLVGEPAPIAIASGRCCYCGHALVSDL